MSLRDRLGPQPKVPGSFDRSTTIAETLSRETLLRERFGITRVAEITHLDRIGIPVFSAVVPDSAEPISVYNGKGITVEAARAGAVMEAVERQAAARSSFDGRTFTGTWPIDDLLSSPRSVPPVAALSAALAARGRRRFSSNGLASGNCLAEAVYHALTEAIERHVWSVVHAIAHLRPNAIFSAFVGRPAQIRGLIDDNVAMELSPPTGSEVVDRLIHQIRTAGMHVVLRAVELRPFPMLFLATIVEPESRVSASHTGMGCSLSPEHAAIRAITEAAQSRASDMHASREDLLRADDIPPTGFTAHNRRHSDLPTGRWFFDAPARAGSITSLRDDSSPDVATDVDTLLTALRNANVASAFIVDLSPPGVPASIVRAVVPGLESALADDSIGSMIASILDPSKTPTVLNQIAC